MVRYIGMDVHREFAQLAVVEDGLVRDEGRIGVTPEALRQWAGGSAAMIRWRWRRPGTATRSRPDEIETLRTYSHLWPDSDTRTRAAVDAMFTPAADSLRTGNQPRPV